MASPRPVPEPSSVARWNRSKSQGRSSGGIPGPLSSTAMLVRLPWADTTMRTVPPSPAYRQALSTSTPASRSIQSGGAVTRGSASPWRSTDNAMPREWATAPKRSAQPWATADDVDELVARRGRLGVEAGQPQQVVDDASQPLALAVDPLDSVSVPGGVATGAERQRHLCLDDAEWRSKFVRCVGGEFELPTTCLFDRPRRLEPDDQGTEEHGHDDDRPGDGFSGDEYSPLVCRVGSGSAPPRASRRPPGSRPPGTRSSRAATWWADRSRDQAPRGRRGAASLKANVWPGTIHVPQQDRGDIHIVVVVRLARRSREITIGRMTSCSLSRRCASTCATSRWESTTSKTTLTIT